MQKCIYLDLTRNNNKKQKDKNTMKLTTVVFVG